MFSIKLDPHQSFIFNAVDPVGNPVNGVSDIAGRGLQSGNHGMHSSETSLLYFSKRVIEVDLSLLRTFSNCKDWQSQPLDVDISIDPVEVKLVMRFLRGEEIQISPNNIRGILKVIDYFEIPIVWDYLTKDLQKFADCFSALNEQWDSQKLADQLVHFLNGFRMNREMQLELFSKLKMAPEHKQMLIDSVPSYEDPLIQRFLFLQQELASEKKLHVHSCELIAVFKKMSPEEFMKIVGYLHKAPVIKEKGFIALIKTLVNFDDQARENFFDSLKQSIECPKVKVFVDYLKTAFEEIKSFPFRFPISDSRSIETHLNLKISALQGNIGRVYAKLYSADLSEKKIVVNSVKIVKFLMKIPMQCMANAKKQNEILKRWENRDRILAITIGVILYASFVTSICFLVWRRNAITIALNSSIVAISLLTLVGAYAYYKSTFRKKHELFKLKHLIGNLNE